MANAELQNALIIPFDRGLDTKSDPKVVQPPFLVEVDDGILTKTNTLSPRPGTEELVASNAPRQATGIASYDNELLVFDDSNLRTYSPSTQTWINRGAANSVSTGAENIVKNNNNDESCDWYILNDIAVYCWKEAGGVYAATQDRATGAYFLTRTQLGNANCTAPRALGIGNNLYVGFGDGSGNFVVCMFPLVNPATFLRKIIVTDMDPSGTFDWCFSTGFSTAGRYNEAVGLAYKQNIPNHLVVALIDPLGFVGFGPNVAGPPQSIDCGAPISVIGVHCTPSVAADSMHTVVQLATQFSYYNIYFYDLSTLASVSPISDPNGNHNAQHVVVQVDGTQQPHFFYDIPSAQGSAGTLTPPNVLYGGYIQRVDISLTVPFAYNTHTIARNQAIAGKAFRVNQSNDGGEIIDTFYLPTIYPSYLQACYFVLSMTSGNMAVVPAPTNWDNAPVSVLSSHLFGQASNISNPSVGLPLEATSGVFSWPMLRQQNVQSVDGALFTINGVALASVDFVATGRYLKGRMGEEIHFAGGIVQSYDGATLVEHSYLLAPERVYSVTHATTGGHMSDGDYEVQIIWKWIDKRGQIHRSATSVPFAFSLTGGTSTQQVTYSILPLVLTQKTDVLIEIYRTTGDGSIPFNVSNGTLFNDPSATGLITFTDTLADLTIENNEILYTVGGELDNDPPPAASLMAAGKRRLFLAGAENPYQIYYSKLQTSGVGMGFSLALLIEIDHVYGFITAIGVMDDKVVVFTRNSMLYFSGDGPDDAGANNSFTVPSLIASDVGCITPQSLVLGAEGLYFMSAKGLYLLSRSLQVSYVGAPVEKHNALSISSALLLPQTNQIRFGSSDTAPSARCLVYNYFFQEAFSDQVQAGQWTTFTKYQHIAATIWQGKYVFATSDGRIFVDDGTRDTDGLKPICMRAKTAPLTAAILGFNTMPELAVLGNYLSEHVLLVNLYFDYQTYFSAQLQFDTRTGLDVTLLGEEKRLGDIPTWGGNTNNGYQFKARIPHQLCEALQLEFIAIVPAGAKAGQCYELNALAVIMNKESGLARMPPSHSI